MFRNDFKISNEKVTIGEYAYKCHRDVDWVTIFFPNGSKLSEHPNNIFIHGRPPKTVQEFQEVDLNFRKKFFETHLKSGQFQDQLPFVFQNINRLEAELGLPLSEKPLALKQIMVKGLETFKRIDHIFFNTAAPDDQKKAKDFSHCDFKHSTPVEEKPDVPKP